ncbi:hypothetical protein [Sinorhizobium medicae]|uniref:hypothetical protein n=1 Tax=Sinorhizobium medicae TaxID=110321 RepID=UPI001913E619|nr:hypothetical protein [Sinorhizobium medicae]UWU12497.1 hypothetical protein N2598_30880 [Sinorhizobium medicae]
MKKQTGCAVARPNAPKRKPSSLSAASCWSILVTALVAAAVIRSMPGGDGAENPAVAMALTLKRAAHIESPGEHHRMDANCAEFGTR